MPLIPIIIKFLWDNKQIIAEILGAIAVAIVCWWFFIHNPKIIKGLEADKAELARQVEAGKAAITLLDDIQKGRTKIDATTYKNISTIKANHMPKRTVLVSGGVPLQAVPTSKFAP